MWAGGRARLSRYPVILYPYYYPVEVVDDDLLLESCGLVRPVFASSGLLLVCDTDTTQARAHHYFDVSWC